jgi:hypothetical protein
MTNVTRVGVGEGLALKMISKLEKGDPKKKMFCWVE